MIVRNVKFSNNKVEIVLDKKSFFISKENYIENAVAINSEISEEKINSLLEYEKVIESKMYLIKLLNKKALSEYEVYKKLLEKGIDDSYIKKIINNLSRMGLINDEFVAIVNLESMLLKKKGKREIVKNLKEKKINDTIIDKLIKEIDEEVYIDNFNKLVNKYLKMYDGKSYKVKENLLRQKLENIGYENEIISSINIDNDLDNEYELVKKEVVKMVKLKSIVLSNYENVNKLKRKLVVKGFSYDIINKVIEEVKCYETY